MLSSTDTPLQDGNFPRVERDIHQVEQFSRHFKSRMTQGDPTTNYLDASRLLAQEGLNPRQLDLALQTFDIKSSQEDDMRQQGADVETYVQQVHDLVSATAIQATHENIVSAFERHLGSYLDSTWQRQKKALFDTADPFSLPAQVSVGAQTKQGHVLRGRAARYSDVVKAMNAGIAGESRIDCAEMFLSSCKTSAQSTKELSATSLVRIWYIVQQISSKLSDIPLSAASQRQVLMIQGSKRYLEENFVAHMESVVQAHRTVAALGGLPSKQRLIEAYLRVKEKNLGALDFDSPGGIDTTWARIYFCLRAGYTKEALDIVEKKLKPEQYVSGSPSEWVKEWIEDGCRPLIGDKASSALAECEKILASNQPYTQGRSSSTEMRNHYIAAICALAAGSVRCADCISRDVPGFFPTIEDYLWFRLTLVRTKGSQRLEAIASTFVESYNLSDLQDNINQYQASHYSKGGQEPLLYAAVLLFSLQPEKAIEYLSTNPATQDYRVDAVHLAICLWYLHIIPAAEASAAAKIVHQYAYSLIHHDIALALEYYMIASMVMGGSLEVKGRLLKELLTESQAYGVLLGSGGAVSDGGALAVFFPDRTHRLQVLEAVAQECAAAAQYDEAIELFMVGEKPASALKLLNHRISEGIEASLTEPHYGEFLHRPTLG